MFRSNLSPCSGAAARGRAALTWGAACFICGQLLLAFILTTWWPARDPEYGWRLVSLRARMAERAPARPLVLFLGSSRVAMGLRPGLLQANRRDPRGPVVFNAGRLGAGPLAELVCLRRLLADGIHPDCLFIEVWPTMAEMDENAQMAALPRDRLCEEDLRVLRSCGVGPPSEPGLWRRKLPDLLRGGKALVPALSRRTHLLNQWAPSWVARDKRDGRAWKGLDGWGWLAIPGMKKDEGRWRVPKDALGRPVVTSAYDLFAPSPVSLRAFAELLARCKMEHITVALVALPDASLAGYSTVARDRMDRFICGLSQENAAPLVDARAWSVDDDFLDGCHLTPAGAAAFTERLDREVLQPYLDGEPLARRWQPGGGFSLKVESGEDAHGAKDQIPQP